MQKKKEKEKRKEKKRSDMLISYARDKETFMPSFLPHASFEKSSKKDISRS
jgi:hypothetical protein